MKIRVAIVGVGNCAKSLIEGVSFYRGQTETNGLAFPIIGGYSGHDLEFVAAWDVDSRKVGKPIHQAINAPPNCATLIKSVVDDVCTPKTIVRKGPVLDGVAGHMRAKNENDLERFHVDPSQIEDSIDDVVTHLDQSGVDVVLLYLPVGSQEATEFYVKCCLRARIPFVNCIPVFIVSDPVWGGRIEAAGIPAIGDDMRSQVGASVLSQVIHEMFLDRGAVVDFHCQQNSGGNTDFLNMTDATRLSSKKVSKENVVTSQGDLRGLSSGSVHAGPSDYVPYLKDNKVAHIRVEARGFGNVPIILDARLSVQDSPNSAGVVIDAVRYVHVAHRLGMKGPLVGPSAFTQKTPPVQLRFRDAYEECKKLAETVL